MHPKNCVTERRDFVETAGLETVPGARVGLVDRTPGTRTMRGGQGITPVPAHANEENYGSQVDETRTT